MNSYAMTSVLQRGETSDDPWNDQLLKKIFSRKPWTFGRLIPESARNRLAIYIFCGFQVYQSRPSGDKRKDSGETKAITHPHRNAELYSYIPNPL